MLYTERFVAEGIPVGFLGLGTALVAEKWIYLPNSIGVLSLIVPALWTSLPVIGGVCVLAARRFARRWVFNSLVALERAAYDAVWASIAAEHPVDLAALCCTAASIAAGLPHRAARQLHLYPGAGEPDEQISVPLSPAAAPAVKSLDQLYDQAACASLLLRCKVQELALATGGYVRAKPARPVTSDAKSSSGRRTSSYVRCCNTAHPDWAMHVTAAKLIAVQLALCSWG